MSGSGYTGRVRRNLPETRARVLAAAEQLQYVPSLSARSLAGRRSYLIGLIYENPSANYLIDLQHGIVSREMFSDLWKDVKAPLEWDKKQLTIIDPHFYFYLRYVGK